MGTGPEVGPALGTLSAQGAREVWAPCGFVPRPLGGRAGGGGASGSWWGAGSLPTVSSEGRDIDPAGWGSLSSASSRPLHPDLENKHIRNEWDPHPRRGRGGGPVMRKHAAHARPVSPRHAVGQVRPESKRRGLPGATAVLSSPPPCTPPCALLRHGLLFLSRLTFALALRIVQRMAEPGCKQAGRHRCAVLVSRPAQSFSLRLQAGLLQGLVSVWRCGLPGRWPLGPEALCSGLSDPEFRV